MHPASRRDVRTAAREHIGETHPSGKRRAGDESAQEPECEDGGRVRRLDDGGVEQQERGEAADVHRVAPDGRHVLEGREDHGAHSVGEYVEREAERRACLRDAEGDHQGWY